MFLRNSAKHKYGAKFLLRTTYSQASGRSNLHLSFVTGRRPANNVGEAGASPDLDGIK
ncbi:hypothetical protein ACWKW6_32880 [Dyadobacter jiangsuensis]